MVQEYNLHFSVPEMCNFCCITWVQGVSLICVIVDQLSGTATTLLCYFDHHQVYLGTACFLDTTGPLASTTATPP